VNFKTGRPSNKIILIEFEKAKSFAVENELLIRGLKGLIDIALLMDCYQIFNSSGSSIWGRRENLGDVLDGMITSLLSKWANTPENAALCGVFHHGLSWRNSWEIKKKRVDCSDIMKPYPLHIP